MTTPTSTQSLKRTPLHGQHRALGARLIDFGGWEMPVSYPPGIIKEHRAVRASLGIFDVSHMGEAVLRGPRAAEAVQRVITNDVGKLRDGGALYTVMCTPAGGIVDDCIVYRRRQDDFLIILNASNTAKDLAWLRENTGAMVEVIDESEATALLAVQGPRAVAVLSSLSRQPLAEVARFHLVQAEIAGVPCMAARTGYTGEDGFELACPAAHAPALWTAILEAGRSEGIEAVGLGARDTLRLEARLCLYGNDIDETTSPYEAGLGWVVALDGTTDFIGKDALRRQKAEGVNRKLIGFHIEGRGIARHGYDIIDRQHGTTIGRVTSGTSGISVSGAIGMGYVPSGHAAPGTELAIDCRGKQVAARVVKGPFYQRKN